MSALEEIQYLEFIREGYVWVPNPITGQLGPMNLYPLQETFGREVWDVLDPTTGVRRFRRAVFSVPKKFGKTSGPGATSGLYHLLFDPFEREREIYSIAGDYDQALLVLKAAKKMIKFSPLLRELFKNQKQYEREIVYEDALTGEVHRWQALSSDSPTSHGLNPSLVLIDEGWQFTDYNLLEAVSLGPQRRCPLQLWVTYAGLRSQMVDGVPLYDLYRAGLAGSDPMLYFCWRDGLEAYNELPDGFIRAGYLEEQRRLLPANRFARLHLNQWGARDVGFLSDEDIAGATDAQLLPLERSDEPHVLAVDYGRVKDATALVLTRKGLAPVNVQVSRAQIIQGSQEAPVPLDVVEEAIVDLNGRFNLQRIVIDPFQMLGTAERLSKRLGLPMFDTATADAQPRRRAIVMRPIGPQFLNRLTMALLALFRSKGIRIPGSLRDLLSQLGSVVVKDTYYGVRVDSGAGVGVRAHDDLVVSLGMAVLELMARGTGFELPAFACHAGAQYAARCFLFEPTQGQMWPHHAVVGCSTCTGWKALRDAHQLAEAAKGQAIDLRAFNRDAVLRQPSAVGSAWVDGV